MTGAGPGTGAGTGTGTRRATRARAGVRAAPSAYQRTLEETARSLSDDDTDDLPVEPDLVLDDSPVADEETEVPLGDEDDWRGADDGFADDEPPDERVDTQRIEIAFWTTPAGEISTALREFAVTGDADQDEAARIAQERLRNAAAAILELHSDAVAATSRREAFRALAPYTEEELARRAADLDLTPDSEETPKQYATFFSRHRDWLVAIRSGVVPLEFFWWASTTTDMLIDLWDGGHRDGTGEVIALRQAIAARHGLKPDSVSRHERALRVLRDRWAVVARYQREWPRFGVEALCLALGLPRTRAESAVRLAISGALTPPEHHDHAEPVFAPGLRVRGSEDTP